MIAVICDLDGLLVDSEQFHFEAYQLMLGEYGVKINRQMFIDAWLSGNHYGTSYYLGKAGLNAEEIDDARKKKAEYYLEISKGRLTVMPGAKSFLEGLKQRGIPCGIGTGGHSPEYEFTIEECGLEDYVQTVIGGTDVQKNKPAPDIFLKVAEGLEAEVGDCVVFENSSVGMNAGLAAGMRCIVIPSEFTKEQDFSKATHVFSSLEDIELDKLSVL